MATGTNYEPADGMVHRDQCCPPPPPGGECHPSYDPCVPIAGDVDCAGGGGNGPVYTGRVRVIGPDEYGLDDDNDGVGCENS